MSADIDRLLENTEAYPRAFPFVVRDGDYSGVVTGLTKREYYASAAMHGLLASGASYDMDRIEIAAESVKYAEALQAALAAMEATG